MKLGFVSLPFTGHLNSMTALARKMRSRGHDVVFVGIPDIEPTIRAAGLTFVPYCENEFPVGSLDKYLAPISRLHGLAAVQNTNLHLTPGLAKAAFEHLPGLIKEIGIQAIVMDTLHRFLELIPMSLNIPCVHIWSTLHIDGTGTTPACVYDWPHENTPEARTRNLEGLKKLGGMASPSLNLAKAYAAKAGLQIDWSSPGTAVPKLAVITQTPKEFDFQGIPWPPQFHYAGPFHEIEGHAPAELVDAVGKIAAKLGAGVVGHGEVLPRRTPVEPGTLIEWRAVVGRPQTRLGIDHQIGLRIDSSIDLQVEALDRQIDDPTCISRRARRRDAIGRHRGQKPVSQRLHRFRIVQRRAQVTISGIDHRRRGCPARADDRPNRRGDNGRTQPENCAPQTAD